MSSRSWFFAAGGQQQGPYPEAQFRDLIARGTVRADTLVWTEGMAGWQKAGEIPGLMASAGGIPASPQTGDTPVSGGGAGGALSLDVGVWSLLGRGLLYTIGTLLVIPAPWAGTSFYRWAVPRLRVPGRPDLAFNGQVGDLWYVFVLTGLLSYAGLYDNYTQLLAVPVQGFLSWMLLRWLASNLSSNGRPLRVAFNGDPLTFIGWQILFSASIFTIIGWAWVATAWMRWNLRHITGTRREVVFNATGLGLLWRTIVFAIACGLVIPIPWALHWFAGWTVSQVELVERGPLRSA